MFSEYVDYLPPFNEQVEDRLLSKAITLGDKTLVMTFYALFHKRCPGYKFNFIIGRNDFNIDLTPETITFGLVRPPQGELPESIIDFSKFEKFLSQKLKTDVHICAIDETKVIVYSGRVDTSVLHAVQVFIPQYYPKLFESMPRTEFETKLLVSLSQNTSTAYYRAMQEFVNDEDVRHDLMRSVIIGLERRIRYMKLDRSKDALASINNDMQSLLDQYSVLNERRLTQEAIVSGLTVALQNVEEDTEFEEYLCSNNNLSNIQIDSTKIAFTVKTFVNPYLPDDWDTLSSRGSIFQGRGRVGKIIDEPENLKLLLDAIFSRNHTLKLRMCARFVMDYYGGRVDSPTGYNYAAHDPSLKDYIPNTHLDRYNCFGQNKVDILEQLKDNDLIGAIECCINVAKRINVSENATFGPFIDVLKGCDHKCIVAEDGTEMTTTEAIEYLKGKMKNETSSDCGREEVAS